MALVFRNNMEVHGTGIEFRTDRKPDQDFMFDSVSWTRVRMAIYPSTIRIPPQPDFCSDFGKPKI